MLASIFSEAGYRIGLFTSPHLEDFCERIRVGDLLITPEEVLRHAGSIRNAETETLTFFEVATAIAFLHFREARVDLAVVETGLGGRLDATNVVTPLVSVITSIGRDHTAVLGDSIEEIAYEKGGIIKPGVPVVAGPMPAEALEVIREQAAVKGARFVPLSMNLIPPNVRVGLAGDHQRWNGALASAVVEVLGATGGVSVPREAVWPPSRAVASAVPREAVLRGLENVRWPGRLETVSEEPWIILDGAHNPEAMRTACEFLENRLDGRRLKVVFGAMADKDLKGILAEIAPIASEIIVTAPRLKRAARPEDLAEVVKSLGREATPCTDVASALDRAVGSLTMEEVLLVCGSFVLVGEAKNWLRRNR